VPLASDQPKLDQTWALSQEARGRGIVRRLGVRSSEMLGRSVIACDLDLGKEPLRREIAQIVAEVRAIQASGAVGWRCEHCAESV